MFVSVLYTVLCSVLNCTHKVPVSRKIVRVQQRTEVKWLLSAAALKVFWDIHIRSLEASC